MTTLLAFVACAALGQSSNLPVGAAAVDRVKSILTACGVPKPFRLQGLATSYNPGNDFTRVQLTDAKGREYETYLRPNLIQLFRENARTDGGHQPKEDSSAAARAKLTGWMEGVGTREPLKLTALTVDEKGYRRAEFSILRNGYPFVVSWQFYGYSFTSDQNGELVSMSASEGPPRVEPGDPTLSESDARARLEAIYRAMQPKSGNPRYTYTITEPLKLGYFKPKDAVRARLVWRIALMASTHTDFGSRGGSSGILIDAVTGNQIKTDVVP